MLWSKLLGKGPSIYDVHTEG